MRVEELLECEHPAALILQGKDDARGVKKEEDPRKIVVIGSTSNAAKVLLNKVETNYTVIEFVSSDHMIWARPENVASLPMGCLSWPKWLKRLHKIEVLPPTELPWNYRGKKMKNTLVVRMTMGPQKEDERVEAKVHHMKTSREIPTLGTLKPAQGEDRRVEIVVETTTDEARDMRKTEDVRQIGGWRNAGEGRVATTFDICEKDIPQHCVGKIWAKTNIRAKEGVALYVNAQQWEELAPLLATCPHQEAVIRERPRWALIEVKPGQGMRW